MKTRVLFVALAIVSAGASYAQNKVNGTVIDRTDNSKLIGVNATLSNDSGQVAGTTTDNNGKFSLDADTGNYILELSYIGYETIRMALTVNDNTHIGTIQMQEGTTFVAVQRADAGFVGWRFPATELANSAYRD